MVEVAAIVTLLKGAFDMLSQGIELVSKSKKKFSLAVDSYLIDPNRKLILALISIVNLNKEPYHIKHINLHFGASIIRHQPIRSISQFDDQGKLLKIDTHKKSFITSKNSFEFLQAIPYQPYLRQNEMAYGLVVFDLADKLESPFSEIMISIEIAGYPEKFVSRIL